MVKICQTGLLKLNFETRPKKRIFRFLPKISAGHGWSWNIFFCQFPNPWALRVSGMGGYTSKCEKKSKSLHPNVQYIAHSQYTLYIIVDSINFSRSLYLSYHHQHKIYLLDSAWLAVSHSFRNLLHALFSQETFRFTGPPAVALLNYMTRKEAVALSQQLPRGRAKKEKVLAAQGRVALP